MGSSVREVKEAGMQMAKPITPVEYARQKGLSLDYVYKQLRVGRIPGTKVGKTWLIPQTAVKPAA
jgi:excisionase family DNA binding protein